MKRPAVTVALPTYNRASLLEQQLAWIETAVSGIEEQCEILISDNCSTDATPAVIEAWCARQNLPHLRIQRQPENIGAVRNIAWCIWQAAGRHVWTISDDDLIDDDALRFVVKMITEEPDLALLLLNFSSTMVGSGRRLFDRCFDVEGDMVVALGGALFDRLLTPRHDSRWGGLALTTAVAYRTDLARDALDGWADGLENLLVQLYVTAFCARRGITMVTARPYIRSMAGRAHFADDPVVYFRMRAVDTSEIMVKLAETGSSWRLCMWKIIERPGAFLRTLPAAASRDPFAVMTAMGRYGGAVARMWIVGLRRLSSVVAGDGRMHHQRA